MWSDDVENGDNGWTPVVATQNGTKGGGWIRTSGTLEFEQYYLAEWRNFSGFDRGLRYAYAHAVGRRRRGADGGLHAVQRSRHAPVVPGLGLLAQRRGGPPVRAAEHRGEGHRPRWWTPIPNPEHYTGAAAEANPSLLDALPGRQQANDAAFGPVGRYPFQACFGTSADPAKYYEVACNRFGSRGAVRRFTDAIGWYPGFEYRPDLDPDDPLFFRDVDASVVDPVEGQPDLLDADHRQERPPPAQPVRHRAR